MTIQQAYQQLLLVLYDIYDDREAANIGDWVIEHITGFKKIDRIINKKFPLNQQQVQQLENHSLLLSQNKPVQYVLNETWFAGMKLFVDENVLIPRPETEELVEWIVADFKAEHSTFNIQQSTFKIIDIGTGSGCIPIALKKKLSQAEVAAIEVSSGALEVAQRNAKEQAVSIEFEQLNFLNENEWNRLEDYNIIVSNPPYIKQSEEALMQKNVLDHEPHLALFVPDEDALLFYKKIAAFAKQHLKEQGTIYLEINEALGEAVSNLFEQHGYNNIITKRDMQGKTSIKDFSLFILKDGLMLF